MVFANAPALRRARAGLREVTSALPRVDPDLDLEGLDDAAFVRLTRRALSHYGDLPRLAGSPLVRLPLVTRRLAARGAADDALERAAELKAVLAESIARLKLRGPAPFGTSDEWRHYNALYFPYVAGLRPYSRRGPDGPVPGGTAGPRAAPRPWSGCARRCPNAPCTIGRAPPPGPWPATCASARGDQVGELRVNWHQIAASGLPVAALSAVRWTWDQRCC